MTFSRRTALTGAAAAALAAGPVSAVAAPAHRDRTLQRDTDAVHATGATGVLAELRTPQGRASARSGVADLTDRRPVPWDAYYRIGSDTKTVTATLALQLVGEGRLSLTDTVERWLPGLVHGHGHDGRRVTVTNLLRQTSGLGDYLDPGDFTPDAYREKRFRAPASAEQQVAAALRKPPAWLPDRDHPEDERRWSYANTNYVLLGLLLEKVTGRPWAQLVHDRVIEPLGLRHTFTPGTSVYLPQPTATAYTAFPGSSRLTDTTLAAGGGSDGGIISTPHDFTTFLSALMGGRLLRPAQLAAMKRTVPADDWIPVRGVRYGLGIAWRPTAASRSGIWFHGGTHLGVISESGVTPDGSRAVAAAMYTLWMDEARKEAQSRAALRLVDNALTRR
ncbi:serine hydrolase domain-containing protein [Streptomyces sp. NPDC059063]|uniref:serine hydrolase domain-containing protein n=1 Tax=unclassified Streptomyces TaxID=2593676 RepID=UPI003692F003